MDNEQENLRTNLFDYLQVQLKKLGLEIRARQTNMQVRVIYKAEIIALYQVRGFYKRGVKFTTEAYPSTYSNTIHSFDMDPTILNYMPKITEAEKPKECKPKNEGEAIVGALFGFGMPTRHYEHDFDGFKQKCLFSIFDKINTYRAYVHSQALLDERLSELSYLMVLAKSNM